MDAETIHQLEQLSADAGFVQTLVTELEQKCQAYLSLLGQSIQDNDHDTFDHASHSLKGISAELGLRQLSQRVQELRIAPPGERAGILGDIEDLYARSLPELKKIAFPGN